ncbi:hypothetical protein SBP02_00430 [Pseudomonas benzenivorans]|uniref:DUF3108 domain-containing protein n=1 Tax=Pseudomonas benzenivorans TaxID=556533 RepID=A0ABZ0PVN1_9PSED|nr:hypothetical protein [Pseudomonas benzenivorans]WPC05250.1 hypothetical protein SBP02_00430 [Pseudomonas benzenivorans]
MKHIVSTTLLISLALASAIYAQTYTVTVNRGEVTETYQGNMDTGELTISWGKETKVFADIVDYAGQTSRTLVSFNGAPALSYENAGSNTHFEVFYTLSLKEKVPFIDCMYGNIRNGQNGASIRKAVCNLDKPLSSEYQDLIFSYSDKWIEASNTVPLQSVIADPPQAADAPLGRLGEVDVTLRYHSVDELMSAAPKTIATAGGKTHEVSSGNVYFVYDADGTTPLSLDVETDPATHTLKRLTSVELLHAIEAN